MPKKPKAETVNLRLRIRVDLLRRLEEAAEKDHRPIASEILRRLEASFQKDATKDLVAEAAKAVEKSMLEKVRPEFEEMRLELEKQLSRHALREFKLRQQLEDLTMIRDSRTGFRLVPKSRTKPRKGGGLAVLRRKAKQEKAR